MAFFKDKNDSINADMMESLSDTIDDAMGRKFATVCDAPLFNGDQKMHGESIIESEGYYRPGYYMLHPFYYVNRQLDLTGFFKDGLLFTAIPANVDLDKIPATTISPNVTAETLEHLPIVVFRNHRGDICYPGTPNDYSITYNCFNDTYEFIGVYKAERLSDGQHLKLTKIFDRYYFNSEKIN